MFGQVENIFVYCGDSVQIMSELNIKFDAVITDIPYQISKDNNFKTMQTSRNRVGIDFGQWDKEFDCSVLSIFNELLKPNGSAVLFHSFEQYPIVKEVLENVGMICKDRILWEKTNPMPRNRDRRYISNCELGSWYIMPNAKWTFNRQDSKYQKMVFHYPSESGGDLRDTTRHRKV